MVSKKQRVTRQSNPQSFLKQISELYPVFIDFIGIIVIYIWDSVCVAHVHSVSFGDSVLCQMPSKLVNVYLSTKLCLNPICLLDSAVGLQ